MITEDYCSFELSKLLKEKGFDWMCNSYYTNLGRVFDHFCCHYFADDEHDKVDILTQTLRPTHQMAMKWLREVYKISIEIYCIPSYTKGLVVWRYMIRNCETCDEVDYPNGYPAQEYLIFEEAVEAALKYVLENLI